MKKTLSLILALLMSASCAVSIFADDTAIADDTTTATTTEAIVDEAVDEAAEEATPYDRAIKFLNTYGIMKGMEDGLLHAEKDVERYQMALFLGRIATGWVKDDKWEDFDANDSGFADLKGTAAENVYGAMSYVSQKGIIEGYPDGTFKPEKVVTYREALTMAVRTLGRQGLEFPWGYIEEAVKLGLTDGIEGVAYTDVINRGVAAQIIYNAMFADGSKLGLANFDRAFGWADILVTSTVVNDTTKDKDGNDVRATYTNADYKTPTGYIAFQTIESDGTLSKDIYYVQSSELGLEGHEDELVLGKPYAALFEIDEKDNLVELVAVEEYAATTVKNEGRTDNEGVAYDVVDKIGAYMKDYTLVEKYSAKILANSGKLANEIIIGQATELKKITFDYGKTPYAFDWDTGDILVATKDKDGNYLIEKDKDGKFDGYTSYEIKYHYNKEYDYYFEIMTEKDVKGNEKFVGISIMTEDDIADIRKAINKACEVEVSDGLGYVSANIGGIYAELNTYDLDKDGLGEYGTYESYGYGKISQNNGDKGIKCPKCDAWRSTVAINNNNLGILEIANGKSQDCGADSHIDGIWWQDEYAPVLDEDGKIVSAYVIYGYNKVTKELKVIKTIEKFSDNLVDADTYYTTGILRGYSISNGYVVIGDQKIYFNEDFGSFDIDKNDKNYKDGAYKAYLTNKFDELFNQFVTYYLLDGKVVEIERANASTTNFIVVESYAGISSDGYIVVNGYSTDDLKLARFRIAVYDSWNEGDFFWYPEESKLKEAFAKGNVYEIRSYDPDEDAYFVDVRGEVNGDKIDVDGIASEKKDVTISFETGYRKYTTKDGKLQSTKKVTSSDKYIIIGEGKDGYMPIAVFEGKAQNSWNVTGDVLVGDKDAKTFIIVNATAIEGFNADAWSNAGLVMVLKYTVLDKFYDGANLDEDEWYLNGATEYGNVVAFNFFTGKFDDVKSSTNIKPKAGHVYKTIDGIIVEDVVDINWFNIWTIMNLTYNDVDAEIPVKKGDHYVASTGTSDYAFAIIPVVEEYFTDDAKKELSKTEVRKIFNITANATDLVNSLKIVKLVNEDGEVTNITSYNKDSWKSDIKGKDEDTYQVWAYAVYAIREDGTVDAVLYIDPDTSKYSITDEKNETVDSINAIALAKDAAIGVAVDTVKTTYTVDNEEDSVSYNVKGLTFQFIGSSPDKDNHSTIKNNKYYFDNLSRCKRDDWNVKLDGNTIDATPIYGTEIDYEEYAYDKDCTDGECTCDMIKAFTIPTDVKVTSKNVQTNAVRLNITAKCRNDLGIGDIEFNVALYVDANDELVVKFAEDSSYPQSVETFDGKTYTQNDLVDVENVD